LGLPVFSQFNSGIPLDTAGYLVGFVPAAYLVGRLYELRKPKSLVGGFGIMTLGTLVIYLCGAGWLATMIGIEAALLAGVLPFLLGDAGKALVAAAAARAANATEPGETPA
jgi:biotin transport system substrate-specific component